MTLRQCFEENGADRLLDAEKEEKLIALGRLLLEYNEKVNLTSLKTEEDVWGRHMVDSALLAPYLSGASTLLDVGCGGGFPSLPTAILCPGISVTAMDSTGKKLAFVEYAAKTLGLSNVTTLCGRAEELCKKPLRESFDAVTARAVAALPVLCELCLPYVRQGGAFYAMKTDVSELAASQRAADVLGAGAVTAHGHVLKLSGVDAERCIIEFKKTKRTPDVYPRRYAVIKVKPL